MVIVPPRPSGRAATAPLDRVAHSDHDTVWKPDLDLTLVAARCRSRQSLCLGLIRDRDWHKRVRCGAIRNRFGSSMIRNCNAAGSTVWRVGGMARLRGASPRFCQGILFFKKTGTIARAAGTTDL